MQILPHLEHWRLLGKLKQPSRNRIQRRLALLLRRQRKRRVSPLGKRHRHQLGVKRRHLLKRQTLRLQRVFELFKPRMLIVFGLEAHHPFQVLDGGIKRAAGVIGRAAGHDPEVVLALHLLAQRLDQPRLADPRLALDQHRLAVAFFRGLPGSQQQPQLLLPPDERQLAAEVPGFLDALQLALGDHPPQLHRPGDALELADP